MNDEAEVIDELAELETRLTAATAYEALGKRGEIGPKITPLTPGTRIFGPAYTVRCVVGDARAVWVALSQAPAGSVLAIDIGGTAHATAIGGTSVRVAMKRGLRGIVTNAAVRDVAEIRELGLPVYAAGVSVRGTLKAHPGHVQVPITIGSAVVEPGDFFVGDDDGLVVVPRAMLPDFRHLVERQQAHELEIERRIEAGEDILDIMGLALS